MKTGTEKIKDKIEMTEQIRSEQDLDLWKESEAGSPAQNIVRVLKRLGVTFGGERVYLFRKNADGNYDCVEEYLTDGAFPKKHLMQNLTPDAVRYYYNYFIRGERLRVKNVEDMKQSDYTLYKILKPQKLQSFYCAQLSFEGEDLGFFGIDNPLPEKFEEIEPVVEMLSYYISAQMHRQTLDQRLAEAEASMLTGSAGRRRPINKRILSIRVDNPVTILYFCVAMKYPYTQIHKDLEQKMLFHAEHILGSVFEPDNVYYLKDDEFLVIAEDTEDCDVSGLQADLETVMQTMDAVNLTAYIGTASTENYTYLAEFFELAYTANARMIRKRQEQKNVYMEKYHMVEDNLPFRDLMEFHPAKDLAQVLYSEYMPTEADSVSMKEQLQMLSRFIVEDDRDRYRSFWMRQLEQAKTDDWEPWVASETFRCVNGSTTFAVNLVAAAYRDENGEVVILAHTK